MSETAQAMATIRSRDPHFNLSDLLMGVRWVQGCLRAVEVEEGGGAGTGARGVVQRLSIAVQVRCAQGSH
jgi:hypothetical protein